jgi:tRNA-dihydrouridine synthase B
MIGRAALLRPWIFRDIVNLIETGSIPDPPRPVEVLDQYFSLLQQLCQKELWLHRLSLFCFWFLQNFAYGRYYFKMAIRQKDVFGFYSELKKMLLRERIPPYPARPILIR